MTSNTLNTFPFFKYVAFSLLLFCGFATGCGGPASSTTEPEANDPPVPVAPIDTAAPAIRPSELRKKLKANDNAVIRQVGGKITHVSLSQSGVTDISPLKGLPLKYLDLRGLPINDLSVLEGMPLEELYLEETKVSDIAALKGLPLRQLYLNHTSVDDISALAETRLEFLNLYGTKVSDISPLTKLPLNTVWLRETSVKDLSPLEGKSLQSLDVQDTPVSDLTLLATLAGLQRLNIAGTDVTDLTPLAKLSLTRLIFTPAKITQGIEIVRDMESLTELDVEFRDPARLTPAEFWRKFDAGEFKQ